jgi:uncharacterized protein YqfA (UPF0365 family)
MNEPDTINPLFFGLVCGMMLLVMLIWVGFAFLLARPWLRSFMNGVPVPIVNIVAMRLRGTPVDMVIDALIALRHSGSSATLADVERAYAVNRGRIFTMQDLVEVVGKEQGGKG